MEHDIGARLGGGKQDVGDGVLIDADPAQRVAENPAHHGNAQQLPLEHEAESDLRPSRSLRSHKTRDFPRHAVVIKRVGSCLADHSVVCRENSSITGIGEQLAGQFLDGSERRAIGRPVDLKLKALSLAYAGHVAEAEPM